MNVCNKKKKDGDFDLQRCGADEYDCGKGVCIAKERVCDGYPDCETGDDELFCETPETSPSVQPETNNGDSEGKQFYYLPIRLRFIIL